MRLLLFLLPAALWGQLSPSCPASITAGTALVCSINYNTPGATAGVQLQLTMSSSVGTPVITTGAAALATAKQVECNGFLCLVYGINLNVIGPGELIHLTIPIPATLTGNIQIGVATTGASAPIASDSSGVMIPVTVNPLVTVSVLQSISKCDINGDGQTNGMDVALVQSYILSGSGIPHDLNGDTKTDVRDLLIVIRAQVAGTCLAT